MNRRNNFFLSKFIDFSLGLLTGILALVLEIIIPDFGNVFLFLLGIALIEEFLKFFVLSRIVKKTRSGFDFWSALLFFAFGFIFWEQFLIWKKSVQGDLLWHFFDDFLVVFFHLFTFFIYGWRLRSFPSSGFFDFLTVFFTIVLHLLYNMSALDLLVFLL